MGVNKKSFQTRRSPGINNKIFDDFENIFKIILNHCDNFSLFSK